MSATTPYSGSLKAKKKEDLKQIALDLKIDDEGTRADLEDRIKDKLIHDSKARSDSKFTKLYESMTASASATANSVMENGQALISKVQGQAASTSPDKVGKELQKSAHQKVARLPSPSRALATVDATAKDVASMVESESAHLIKLFNKYLHVSSVQNQAVKLQKKMGTAEVAVLMTVALEVFVIAYEIIPFTWKLSYGPYKWLAIPIKSTSPIELSLPDIAIFLKWQNFWKPILVYDATLTIPALFGFLINFEAAATGSGARTTRSNAQVRKISLVTFAILRFAMVYYLLLLHTGQGKGPGGSIEMFKTLISPEFLLLSTGVQGAFALYEAIIKHR